MSVLYQNTIHINETDKDCKKLENKIISNKNTEMKNETYYFKSEVVYEEV